MLFCLVIKDFFFSWNINNLHNLLQYAVKCHNWKFERFDWGRGGGLLKKWGDGFKENRY